MSDLISRQDALDAIQQRANRVNDTNSMFLEGLYIAQDIVARCPSVAERKLILGGKRMCGETMRIMEELAKERTAKVTEVKTDDDVYDIKGVHTWCKEYRCEKCGFIQFAIEDHGRYTYCPSCGCRLEWDDVD